MKFSKIKEAFVQKCKLALALAGAVAFPVLSSAPAHAALSADAQSAVDSAVTAFQDIAAAIGDLVVANIGVAIAIVIGAIIVGYIKGGR